MKVLYLGANTGTSLHRYEAIKRCGHSLQLINPHSYLPQHGFFGRLIGKAIFEFGGGLFDFYIRTRLIDQIKNLYFDVVWIDSGDLISYKTLQLLHVYSNKIINYNQDDPFSPRDKNRFKLYLDAIPGYDLTVVVRKENEEEAISFGAKKVLRVFRCADEIAHLRLNPSEVEDNKWSSKVLFVGTWMPERGGFLLKLIELGVPLKIYGDRWHKAKEYSQLKEYWCGGHIDGDSYVKAIQSASISIGLLSKGNRDLHTTRSAEIPYIGSVLCAERTSEHLSMYIENEEAIFWDNAEECAEKCFWLLNNNEALTKISRAGRERCIKNKTLNESLVEKILKKLEN